MKITYLVDYYNYLSFHNLILILILCIIEVSITTPTAFYSFHAYFAFKYGTPVHTHYP